MSAPVSEMLRAGFSKEEIDQWTSERATAMRAAGFDDDEIAEWMGAENPDPEPLQEHFRSAFAGLAAASGQTEDPSTPTIEELPDFTKLFQAGFENSVKGLIASGKLPTTPTPEDPNTFERVMMQAGQLAGDFEAMVGGAVVAGGPANPIGAMAGAFALPAGMRRVLVEQYRNGKIQSAGRFWEVASGAFLDTAKGFLTGAATGGAGKAVGAVGGPAVAQLAAEIATMVTAGAALEGRIPEPHEFIDVGIIVGGLRGARATARAIGETYARTGVTPPEVVRDMQSEPTIAEDLLSTNIETPRAYRPLEKGDTEAARRQADLDRAIERVPIQAPVFNEGIIDVERTLAGLPDVPDGRTRIFRAESPTTKHADIFNRVPSLELDLTGKTGQFYTDDLSYADYYRHAYGRDARIYYADVPNAQLEAARVTPSEYVIDLEATAATPKLKPQEAPEIAPDTAEARILSRISIGEVEAEAPGMLSTFDKFYKHFVDSKHPLAKAVEMMANGKELPLIEDAYQLALLRPGTHAKAEHFLKTGTFDFETDAITGASLKEVLAKAGEDLNPLRVYLAARRAEELRARGIKTGIAPGDASEVTSKALVEQSPLRGVAKDLYDYQQRVLRYFRQSGMVSAEQESAMRVMNQSYVPFGRVLEEEFKGGAQFGRRSVFQLLKEIEGSEKTLVDPLENVIKNTYTLIEMAERNRVAKAFVELAEKSGETGEQFATKAEGPGKSQISVFRNGEREVWNVDPEIYKVFEPMDTPSRNLFVRMLRLPARALRAGVVAVPEYMLRNMGRDQFGSYVFSEHGAKPFTDLARGIASIVKNDKTWQEYQRSGAMINELASLDRAYLQKNLRSLMEEGGLATAARNSIRHPIEALRSLSAIGEQGTRVGGEFRRARAQGKSIKEAGAAARDVSLDFARAGVTSNSMNRITAFWNATIAGHDKLVRGFKAHPARATARSIGAITVPTIALYLMNKDEDWYKSLPQWRKDLFWNYKAGGVIWSYPIPWELGLIFKTLPERMMASLLDQDPHAFDEITQTFQRVMQPSVVPTGTVPLIEAYSNKSLHFDRPIIPQSREGLLPEYQYQPYTTELAKLIGHSIASLPGMKRNIAASPAIIENTVRAWTGGMGQHLLRAANATLTEAGVLPEREDPAATLADIPFIQAFVARNPSSDSEEITRFFNRYVEQKQVIDTIRTLAQEGDSEAAMRELKLQGGLAVNVNGIKETLTGMSALVKAIYRNPEIDREQKRQLIDGFYTQMDAMAKAGNAMLDQAERVKGDLP